MEKNLNLSKFQYLYQTISLILFYKSFFIPNFDIRFHALFDFLGVFHWEVALFWTIYISFFFYFKKPHIFRRWKATIPIIILNLTHSPLLPALPHFQKFPQIQIMNSNNADMNLFYDIFLKSKASQSIFNSYLTYFILANLLR
jgi:hypothetical protein